MSKTVVLIDDDQDDLEILKDVIHSLDPSIHCISFIYPMEAVRVVCEELIVVPDYFFIDINMPGMTGDKCLRVLRAKNEFKHSVISILSTSVQPEMSETLRVLGANHTFQKPTSINSYTTIVERVLGTASTPRRP
jgi:CheY-like chemotaxis protein